VPGTIIYHDMDEEELKIQRKKIAVLIPAVFLRLGLT
jgi:hypothetical protein